MAKLTFFIDGQKVEFDGTVEEVTSFLKTIQNERISLITDEEQRRRSEVLSKDRAEIEEAKRKVPSIEDVKKFIIEQPGYRHTTFDIQKHFFGRTFKARGVSEGLYHDFLHVATEARKQIEQEQRGKFSYELQLGRHKIYTWIPQG